MKNNLSKKYIERYSRQIILKDVGIIGQKKITNSKVLIVGAGGLGCPIADYLSRAGVGTIGIGPDEFRHELFNPIKKRVATKAKICLFPILYLHK